MRKAITVRGVVQGVGYRPFTAALAEELGITGTVCNSGGIVKIEAEGDGEAMDMFICRLRSCAPPAAQITDIRTDDILMNERAKEAPAENGFRIRESEICGGSDLPLLPTDLPICGDCLAEMSNPVNRRFRYPFISCVSCGPRYSIMERIPYDRDHITMREYALCPDCREEYAGRERRRHAQTISCRDCGPQLLFDKFPLESEDPYQHRSLSGDAALEASIHLLKQEGILVLKGIGGYQFACSVSSSKAVSSLREWKMRDKKPFAVMFPNVDMIKRICVVSEEEETLLTSPARPIVLLRWKTRSAYCAQVSSESRYLGAFLPYTGLHQLLTDSCGPLVMTSGNISGEPILTGEEDVWKLKPPCAAGIAWNTRRIAAGLDDSLGRVIGGRSQLIRRSRGYVPAPCVLPVRLSEPVLAFGGDLKACFCLASGERAYISQYFGDIDEYRVCERYRDGLEHMQQLFGIRPRYLVCDLHPGYITGLMARETAAVLGCSLLRVQHHHAHIASVMAENHLDECIGVAFDGTGYGTDGCIWGSEFMVCRKEVYERSASLEYHLLTGADAAAKNAWMSAVCQLIQAGLTDREISMLYADMTGTESGASAGDMSIPAKLKMTRAALDGRINTSQSAAMGRLFDAVSSILGIRQVNSYEGECAAALENMAAHALEQGWEPWPLTFALRREDGLQLICRSAVLRELAAAISVERTEQRQGRLALGFHYALAQTITTVCTQLCHTTGIHTIALSGGVFANHILLEESIRRLEREGFTVCINREIPMNDGCIAYGQAQIAAQSLARRPETV